MVSPKAMSGPVPRPGFEPVSAGLSRRPGPRALRTVSREMPGNRALTTHVRKVMAVTSMRWLVKLRFVLLGVLLGLTVLGCERKLGTETGPVSAASQPAVRQPIAKMDGTKMYKKPSDAELRKQLSPLEYE